MRIASCLLHEKPRLAVRRDQEWVDLTAARGAWTNLRQLLESGESALAELRAARARAPIVDPRELTWLPPVPDPGKILCVGRNYAAHAGEMGAAVEDEPVIFNKLPTTLIGHQQQIVLPVESQEVDYEAELVVVMGQTMRHVPRDSALAGVAGYTCGNDVTARDWQKRKPGGQWLLGKSFDTFGPLGPCLVTADEIDDPHQLAIELRLNGQVMQKGHTSKLIYPIDYLISYLSHVCRLEPGDLIFTGTPPGVGIARQPPVFLQSGDCTQVIIEHVGELTNQVVSADTAELPPGHP